MRGCRFSNTRLLTASLVGCALLQASPLSVAGSASGIVTYFVPFDIGGQEAFVFRLSTMNSDAPACNTSNRFVVTAANPRFKMFFASILAASMSNTPIYVYGSGSCTIYDNASENLAYICLGSTPYPC